MKLNEVSENYDRASYYYDILTEFFFGKLLGIDTLRVDTIEKLGNIWGATILDIGCGTGRNFPTLAKKVGPSGRIIGIDYSEGMLTKARERIQANGWSNIELHQGDAVALRNIDEPVDGIISVWCYGIVHDLPAALDRAVALLRPGARIALMDFDKTFPEQGFLRWLYPFYSAILRWAGIDTKEDLDNNRLQKKWAQGRHLLEVQLEEIGTRRYLQEMGFITWGQKPRKQ